MPQQQNKKQETPHWAAALPGLCSSEMLHKWGLQKRLFQAHVSVIVHDFLFTDKFEASSLDLKLYFIWLEVQMY